MKKFALMHIGFEKPTPEIMDSWNTWFSSIADVTVENIGLGNGVEISESGQKELGWDPQSITGISIVEAEDLDAAIALTEGNPFISSIRVYEIRS